MEDESKRAMAQFQTLNAENMHDERSRRDLAYDVLKYRRILAMTCSDAGTVYLRSGRPGRAEALLRKGAEADPKNVSCRQQLAQILMGANRLPETVPLILELIEIEPDNAIPHLHLAMVYAQLRRLDEARTAAKKALDLAPGNEDCRRFLAELQANR